MLKQMLSGKIHLATVTDTRLHYRGSITIDRRLMDAAGILEDERVEIANMRTGARMATYAMPGRPGGGVIRLNGASARLFEPGDQVIILSYALCNEEEARRTRPKIVHVDGKNRIVKKHGK